jgi:outer membrane protein assembly factor BamA
MYWGWPRRETLDVGSTLFVDAGYMWPGDAPYGRDSGWRASAGAGLRFSFPAGSRTTYRIDVAFPIQPDAGARDMRLMLSVGEILGLIAPFGDNQLTRSRYEGLVSHLFRFRQ